MKTFSLTTVVILLFSLSSCKKKEEKSQDTTAPAITLNGSEQMEIEKGAAASDPGATASDETDGDLSAQIESDWNSKVNTNSLGQYSVTYKVKDKSGNEAVKTRNVTVKFGSSALLGAYSATWTSGGSAVTSATVIAGNNSNEFTVLYYLGPGGPPFKVQRTGVFGDQLTVNEQISQSMSLTGSGTVNGSGNIISLNMTQQYNQTGNTPVSVVMAKL